MVQRYISHSISNTLHYSSEIHPYVGEFSYLCKKSDAWPGQVQTDLAYRSPSTIFAER